MEKAKELIFEFNNLELDEGFYQTFKVLERAEIIEECPDIKTNEEFATIAFIGIVLAMPNLVKLLVKAFASIYKVIRKWFTKADKDNPKFIDSIITFTEKWHQMYIKILRKILKYSGVFKAAKLEDETKQQMAAEVLYYTIIFGLAVYSGVGTVDSIMKAVQHSSLTHGKLAAIEGVMTSLKSIEVKTFIQHIRA